MNIKNTPHKHAEAFCHMQYASKDPHKKIIITIWNSRDGVTPFVMFSKEFGVELQHVNWQHDRYDPSYTPKKGDLIWRDYTEEEAEQVGKDWYQEIRSQYGEVKDLTEDGLKSLGYDWDPRETLKRIVEEGEISAIQSHVESLVGRKQPKFDLVK